MRRFKALTRVFSAFGIVLLLNVAYGLSVLGFREVVLAYTPAAEQISGVTFYDEDDFFMSRTAAPELTDPTLRRMTAELLSEHVTQLRSHTFSRNTSETVTVRIHSGARTVTRVLFLNEAQSRKLTSVITADETVIRAYSTLPEIGSNGFSLSCSPALTDGAALPTIYRTLCEELTAYTQTQFADWYRYVRSSGNDEELSLSASPFSLRLTRNGSSATIYIPWEFTRTVQQYMALQPDTDDAVEQLERMENGDYMMYDFGLSVCKTAEAGASLPPDGNTYYFDSSRDRAADICKALRELLQKAQPADENTTVLSLYIYRYDEVSGTATRYYFALPASAQAELDSLLALMDAYTEVVPTDDAEDII